MENEQRHSSWAAVVGSKSNSHQKQQQQATTSESVLDNWEEAAQDGDRGQELERSVEEKLGQMKQKQSVLLNPGTSSNADDESSAPGFVFDERSFPKPSFHGESRSSADLSNSGPSASTLAAAGAAAAAAPIRILKRPQSSGHLPQQGQSHDQSNPSSSSAAAAASSSTVPAAPAGHAHRNGTSGRSGQQPQQQRTLEERASAYAEARMRIFGVADQQIHDDLPVQPKLSSMPPNNQSSPSSNANR